MSLGSVLNLKNTNGPAFTPLIMAAFTFQQPGSPQLLLSTHPISSLEGGPTFPGIGILPAGNYAGRIAEQDIDAIQSRSKTGIDRVPRISLHLFDADHYLYDNYVLNYGFRGASVQLVLVMWQPGTSNFSTDSIQVFTGTCDMEVMQSGGKTMLITANPGNNTATVKLPNFPCETRCSNSFPMTAAERAMATLQGNAFSACQYSVDQTNGRGNLASTGGPLNDGANVVSAFGDQVTDANKVYIACDFVRSNPSDPNSGCMAKMGNPGGTSIAPDGDLSHDKLGRRTGNFNGIQWNPSTFYSIVTNYTSGNKVSAFSFLNQSILGQFHNIVYGSQWVQAKLANVIESGNDTKVEACLCDGDIGAYGVQLVTVNGILLNQATFTYRAPDPNLFWKFAYDTSGVAATGGRNGSQILDLLGYNTPSYRGLSDTYGSVCRIIAVFYKDIFTGFGTPTVRALVSGKKVKVYMPILSAVGNGSSVTITFAGNLPNGDCAFNSPFTVMISGNTWSSINGEWELSSWTGGPPGTVTLSSSALSGSGTGGYVMYDSGSDSFCGGYSNNANPVWVTLDVMLRSNWKISQINITTLAATARFCYTLISYIDRNGNTSSHPRYMSQFSIESRRTSADVISSVMRSFFGYFWWGSDGLLNLDAERTLADQQPSAIPGSNTSAPVASISYDGAYAVGYSAYSFDENDVIRSGSTDNWSFDINQEESTTDQTPNQISLKFQDMDNGFVDDSLTNSDPIANARAGGALNPGGSTVPENLDILGISNFDQAFRVTNVYMTRLQYGNQRGDGGGTLSLTFGTTVKVAGLRTGSLVQFSWSAWGISNQLFRVTKIQPMKDFQSVRITIQWHDDVWFTGSFGQSAQAYLSNPGSTRQPRSPLPWQPGFLSGLNFNSSQEFLFGVTEIDTVQTDGTAYVQLLVTGILNQNIIATHVNAPQVPTQATTSNTGGSIIGDTTYIIQLSGLDVDGNITGPSHYTYVYVPAGTNTNTITISNIVWYPGTLHGFVYIGTDGFNITYASSVTTPSSSLTITTFTLGSLLIGVIDTVAAAALVRAKRVYHAGILGSTVVSASGSTVTIGAPATGTLTTSLAGYWLLTIGRPGSDTPSSALQIASNAVGSLGETILTMSSPVGTDFQTFDAVVVCLRANIHSLITIGDTNFPNVYNGGFGFTVNDIGRNVRIISGKGRYQERTISGVDTGGTFATVSTPWSEEPDSTSLFIIEDNNWPFSGDVETYQSATAALESNFSVNIFNISGATVLVQVLLTDASGTTFSNSQRSPIRLTYVYGKTGTASRISDGYYTVTPSGGHAVVDLVNGLNQRLVLNGTPVVINAPIFTGGVISDGAYITIYLDQDVTGGRAVPSFAGGADGFSSNIQSQVIMDGSAGTRTSLQVTFHGSIWGLDSQNTGGSVS
jgi:hypothetical protein